jgi:putative ABC transport system substrate-binding protein
MILQPVAIRSIDDFEPAFLAIKKAHANGVIVFRGSLTAASRTRIAELAAKSGLPAMYPDSEFVDAGGLISYGASIPHLWGRAAVYVDKILKGAKPDDLPVEQPTKFEFVINLKAAKQIGLTIPQRVLARADRVIK